MVRRFCWAIVLPGLCLAPALSAGTIAYYSGNLRADATVTDCGQGCTLGSSDDDATWAQWAAVVYQFNVQAVSTMTAVTFGYGGGTSGTGVGVPAGGLEPYLSLFDSGGNLLASTYYGTVCPPGANTVPGGAYGGCNDVLLPGGLLLPGSYQIALTAWANMSFADQQPGVYTLADGFTGLGNLAAGENLNYAFDLILSPLPTEVGRGQVPEPGSAVPLAGLTAALLLARRCRTRKSGRSRQARSL